MNGVTQEDHILNLHKEVDFLRRELASLQISHKLLSAQIDKVLEFAADSRNSLAIAISAQTMASEALIKASTSRSLDEAMGLNNQSSQDDNIVPFDTEGRKGSRYTYFDGLGLDPVKD